MIINRWHGQHFPAAEILIYVLHIGDNIFFFRKGDVLAMYDGRPNGELFLATGTVEDRNPSDCLLFRAELIKADRLYSSKKAIVESLGFSTIEVDFQSTYRYRLANPIYDKHSALDMQACDLNWVDVANTLQDFPIYEDRMPLQLLAYMRLSRVTDPAQLAMVSCSKAEYRTSPTRLKLIPDCLHSSV